MNLAAWAERNGVARVTAYRWFRLGGLAVPAQRVGRLILVNDAANETAQHRRTAVYARVWSADQKADLDRRRKFLALLRDPSVARIVVEHRDRFCCFGSEYVEVAQGRELVVVDSAEVDDDLVRDMTEVLTSMCARRYGKRAAANRAKRALTAAALGDGEAA